VIAMGSPPVAGQGLTSVPDLAAALAVCAKLRPDARPAAVVALASASPLADSAQQQAVTLGEVLPLMNTLGGMCRLVAIGSAAEYGLALHEAAVLNESHPRRPVSAYGKAKAHLMDQVQTIHDQGADVLGLRLFSAAGPQMSPRSLWGAVEAQVRAGKAVIETRSLSGARDILAVREAAAIITALTLAPSRLPPVINIGAGAATPLRPLMHAVLRQHATALRLAEHIDDADPDTFFAADIGLLRQAYQCRAPLTLEDLARHIVKDTVDAA